MKEKQNKKGQITIWVILALVLVGVILLFFFLEKGPVRTAGKTFDSEQFMEDCVQDAVTEAVNIMMPQGGFIDPKNFKIYNNTKIEYLCRNYGFYMPCLNQHPMLISELNEEIRKQIAPRVENCLESMEEEIERRGDSIEIGNEPAEINVSIAPNIVLVEMKKNVRITEKESMKIFEKFDVRVASPIYNLARVAISVVNDERKYCYFEYVGYMTLDQSIDIRKFVMSDSTKIYTIKDKESGKEFNIAIRGCAIPAGI